MTRAYHYTACGLAITSDLAVPGLAAASHTGRSDLHVTVGDRASARAALGKEERIRYVSREPHEDGRPQLVVWSGSTGAHRFLYRDGTEFVINRDATCVSVYWEKPLTNADAAVYLLGPVLGFMMRLRGVVPLHASGVMMGPGATAFVGEAGAGKSTTAGAFATLGYQLLSDDLLPVLDADGQVLAQPSHPRLTVWPDSASALFGTSHNLPPLTPTYDKRYLELESGRRFHGAPVPLRAIYVLDSRTESDTLSIRRLRPRAALIALVRNTYGNYLLDAAMRAYEFDLLSHIVAYIPVRLVTFGDDIAHLVDSCRQLVEREPLDAAEFS